MIIRGKAYTVGNATLAAKCLPPLVRRITNVRGRSEGGQLPRHASESDHKADPSAIEKSLRS
jgi:hypothetical protein